MSKKKLKEEEGKEEEAPVEVSENPACPFCDGDMVEVSSIDTIEGTEVVYQCKTCGFQAKFIKGA